MTDREKRPERIEFPGSAEEKTRPLRTMESESVDPEAPTVEITTRPDLKTPVSLADVELTRGERDEEDDDAEEDDEDDEPDEDPEEDEDDE